MLYSFPSDGYIGLARGRGLSPQCWGSQGGNDEYHTCPLRLPSPHRTETGMTADRPSFFKILVKLIHLKVMLFICLRNPITLGYFYI
jgi:hypothetical protein